MKKLLIFIILLFFIALGLLMFNAPKIFGTEGAQGDGLPEIMQYFGIIIFILSVLALAFYFINFIFNKNPVLKWAFIIGFYALVPVLIALWSGGLRTHGEGSPLYILILPVFWPLLPLAIFSGTIINWLVKIGVNIDSSLTYGLALILNVVWSFLIGLLIGWLIQRKRAKKEKIR